MIKSVENIKSIDGKRFLIRVDYNVPIKNGRVLEDLKIRRSLATIRYLYLRGGKVVLVSHLGRPKGKRSSKYSLAPVAKTLFRLLGKRVIFNTKPVGSRRFVKEIEKMKNGQVMLLENIRFYPEEEKNSADFSLALAEDFDFFINDAFAASHRAHASVVGVAKYLPAYAGLNLLEEVKNLSKILQHPKKPMLLIIGGAKISTKIKVIKNLLPRAQNVLLGGGLVSNLLAAGGYEVGSSLADSESVRVAKGLLRHANKKIVMPEDLVIGDANNQKKLRVVRLALSDKKICVKGEAIYDIGPLTVDKYRLLLKSAKTIVWNGPLGLIEVPVFSRATIDIAEAIAKSSADTYTGGGETIQIINKLGLMKRFTYVSTGGGAMLEFLEGKPLPGLKILSK